MEVIFSTRKEREIVSIEGSCLVYCLVIKENEEDREPIMVTVGRLFTHIRPAYEYFSSKLIGMDIHPGTSYSIPCAGYFSALSDEFAGMFWEIEGRFSPTDVMGGYEDHLMRAFKPYGLTKQRE